MHYLCSFSFNASSWANVLILSSHLQALSDMSGFLKRNESNSPFELNSTQPSWNAKLYCMKWLNPQHFYDNFFIHYNKRIKCQIVKGFELTMASFLSVYSATSIKTLQTAKKINK